MASPAPLADEWFLTGPTAGGKTQVALALARRLGAQIVSLDSMAVYRGMDIGTAKPSARERSQVPHWLIDVVDPADEFSVAQYLQAAQEAVEQIRRAGGRPLFVGGTPLYLKALLRGLAPGPAADWQLREELADVARRSGPQALHERLTAVDPVAAARLHPNDARRLIRRAGISRHHGRADQRQPAGIQPRTTCGGLPGIRAGLAAGGTQRADRRSAWTPCSNADWSRKSRSCASAGRTLSRTAAQALGYREVLEHLAGSQDLADTIALVKTRTPAVRQAADDLVSQFERMPLRANGR